MHTKVQEKMPINRMMYRYSVFLIFLFLLSCGSNKPVYDSSVMVERYFRYAQDARNQKKYKLALQYYDIIIDNFPNQPDKVASAKYEKGSLYYRMKKYKQALEMFTDVLAMMNNPATAQSVSPAVAYLTKDLGQKTADLVNKDGGKNEGG